MMRVWVCDLWGLWVGSVVEEEGGWVFGCGDWDGVLWVVGF